MKTTNVKYIRIKKIKDFSTNKQLFFWNAYTGNHKMVCWSGEEFVSESNAIRAAGNTFPGIPIKESK